VLHFWAATTFQIGPPDEWVLTPAAVGRIITVRQPVVAGFLWTDRFYTREQTAQRQDAKYLNHPQSVP
jgi:hypothetical protein